ncbi:hypothetical protein JCM3766R1_005399 [Sporobolomyces carnicolor]
MCVMNLDPYERRFSQSHPSLSSFALHSPRPSGLPRLAGSLPPSPSIGGTEQPFPSVLVGSLASPHRIAPPTSFTPGDGPDPEVYAKAYDMLRQRWVGREEEIKSMDAAKPAQKRRFEDSSALRKSASRRSSLRSQEVVESLKDKERRDEEVEDRDVKPLKRSKTSNDNLISFFDNPPPPSSSFDDEGFLQPPLPARRSQSLSPRVASRSTLPPSPSSPPSPRAVPLIPRKRSVSQPCEPRPRFPVSTTRQYSLESAALSAPSTSLPPSHSAPQLNQLASPMAGPSSRSEALLHVVKSFEAVLACRAEGWRRLASRKSSATSWTNPNDFPPSPSL